MLFILLLIITAVYLLPVKHCFLEKEEIAAKYNDKAAEEKEDFKKDKDYTTDIPAIKIPVLATAVPNGTSDFRIFSLFHAVETPPPDLV